MEDVVRRDIVVAELKQKPRLIGAASGKPVVVCKVVADASTELGIEMQ